MVNVNELRIGNYVMDRGLIHRVIGIINEEGNKIYDNKKDPTIITKFNEIELKHSERHLDGIPLTEEILLNCGFSKSIGESKIMTNGIIFYSKGEILLSYDFHLLECIFDDNGDVWHYSEKEMIIFYVHELQHLYYILSGEELEIKL